MPPGISDLKIEGLPDDDKAWLVVARLGLVRNPPKLQEPAVLLLLAEGDWGGRLRQARVGLSHINLVRLNSVWQNGRFVRDLQMQPIKVFMDGSDFLPEVRTPELLRMCRVNPSSATGGLLLSHSLSLEIRDGNKRYLIPSLELFGRCYGFSEYVRGRLATLPFQEVMRSLIARDAVACLPGYWLVTLDMNCYDRDAVFLAHLKHDAITQSRVRRLCGAIQATGTGRVATLIAPPVQPWWGAQVELACQAIAYGKEPGTYVVVRIDGMSDPQGPPILRDRQNTNRIEHGSAESGEGSAASGWRPPYKNAASVDPDELVHTQEPSRDFALRHIQNPAMKILGLERAVRPVIRIVDKSAPRAHGEPEPHPTALSSGPEARTGIDSPAPVVIATPADGLAQQVWASLHAVLGSDYPGSSLLTWDGTSWVDSALPIGVPILASDVEHAHSWYYIHDQQRSRNFYWARALLPTGVVNLVEIERRYTDAGETENLCGVGFCIGDLAEVKEICSYASEHGGVFAHNTLGVVLLRHRHDKAGTLEAAVRRLFGRLGHASLNKPNARDANTSAAGINTVGDDVSSFCCMGMAQSP